jgi:hypothetical protein
MIPKGEIGDSGGVRWGDSGKFGEMPSMAFGNGDSGRLGAGRPADKGLQVCCGVRGAGSRQ